MHPLYNLYWYIQPMAIQSKVFQWTTNHFGIIQNKHYILYLRSHNFEPHLHLFHFLGCLKLKVGLKLLIPFRLWIPTKSTAINTLICTPQSILTQNATLTKMNKWINICNKTTGSLRLFLGCFFFFLHFLDFSFPLLLSFLFFLLPLSILFSLCFSFFLFLFLLFFLNQ